MSKREEQRREADRMFEELRQSIEGFTNKQLLESLRSVPRRKYLEIEKGEFLAIGLLANLAADRILALTSPLLRAELETSPVAGCWDCSASLFGKCDNHR